jgi:hypothetical protein
MWIDPQIPAHLGEEVAADLFPSILEGREFFAKIQPAMASLSLGSHELTADIHLSSELPHPTLEFHSPHHLIVGQFCPSVKMWAIRISFKSCEI